MKTSKLFSIACFTAALASAGCKKKETASPAADDKAAATKPTEPAATAPTPTPTAAPAVAATIASDDDYVSQASVMLDNMVNAVKSSGTDCDKLADSITKLASDHAPQMASLSAYEKAHPDAKKKFDAAAKDKTKAFEEAAGPAMAACQNNKKVGEAFEKLGG